GWKNLIQLSTRAHLEGYYYKPRIDKEILREHREGLIVLSGCLGGEIAQALLLGKKDEAKRIALEYQEIMGKENYFLEIQKHINIPESEKIEPLLLQLAKETGIPLVATQDLHYLTKDEAEYHDILLAVQTGNTLSDTNRLTMKNEDFSMTSPEEIAEKFSFVPEAIVNTQRIADRCNLEIPLGSVLLPHFEKPDGKTANAYLRELVNERIGERFTKEEQNAEVLERIEYELGVIEKTGFADYFLIVQDLINWAKDHGIAVGPGRGSAAGSLLSYILRITDINPLAYDLLFERFLNPDRIQMPDVDIDFADTRRDEVLAYAREKYGNDRVAQIITFGTMAARAAVRDTGRAMGLPYAFCDQVAKLIPGTPHLELKTALDEVIELKELYDTSADAKKLLDAALHLEGVARHASVHACGTVISKDPLVNHVPLQFAPQDKTSIITQFEMHTIEDLGLLKIDFLGLRNLSTIQDTIRLVREAKGEMINVSKLPLDDAPTFALLQAGETTGVFQFESSGMRRYMKEMKPTMLEDLIALVALFRPGPMELIPTFINRKEGREKSTYLHPKLEPILSKTYGIGVYQEQMMRIARDLAGFTLAEADTLRKAIGKKIKSLLDEQKEKLISGMIKNDIPEKIAKAIWELFPPFARYGFNKSHAACYALIGYQTAYLKTHYPLEFMASLLNAEMSDIERISFLIQEAKEQKISILPPDINRSFVTFTPEEGDGLAIRFGLLAIKNVGSAIVENIIEERSRGGTFKDLTDLVKRVQHKDLNKKSLESLAKSGALESLGATRHEVIENIEEILKFSTLVRRAAAESASSLFGSNHTSSPSLVLKALTTPPNEQDKLVWEKELLGFFLSDHPLNRFTAKMKEWQSTPIDQAREPKNDGHTIKILALVSRIQKIVTKNGQPMIFAHIEDFSPKPLEVVVFNDILTKTNQVWQESNVVYLKGKISWRNGEPKMICENAVTLS
ncbi:MAG: DNA polymerase III subunit alpha, partial [Patescibacteria group bacterium]